ncbi:MAG TPA: hypothetical protein PKW69_16565, partial [Niabella sp.]|nr:hypothetical protein [Niabella sp.]
MRIAFYLISFLLLSIKEVTGQAKLYIDTGCELSVFISPPILPYFIQSRFFDDTVVKCKLILTNNSFRDIKMAGELDYPTDITDNPSLKIIGDLNYYYEIDFYDEQKKEWVRIKNELVYNDISPVYTEEEPIVRTIASKTTLTT